MDAQSDVCADCSALSPQWASVNRGVLLCDECSAVHRQLGRHISQVKHLKKSRWRLTQLEMVRYLAAACANRYWEHVLYEPMLATMQQQQHTSSRTTDKPTRTRKPNPTDPMHPTKADFIREKYLFLGFFKKPRNISLDDLNQQLHASVRTSVLETSLYLLALGANPNFIHPTKGTSPMHVACHYGQLGQVEILLAYGADVCLQDSRGQTPVDVALDKALAAVEAMRSVPTVNLSHEQKLRHCWSPLVDTLVNAYYEVTDSLAYFLSRRVPDHRSAVLGPSAKSSPMLSTRHGRKMSRSTTSSLISSGTAVGALNGHFLISTPLLLLPTADGDLNGTVAGSELDDWIQEARRRLNQLPNVAFEDLCVDVYDEADRRLTNSFLEATDVSNAEEKTHGNQDKNHSDGSRRDVGQVPVPPPHKITPSANRSLTLYFLPPNTAYSSVRNQARQKLGRLSTVEFHTLVLDILTEVSARLLPLFPPVLSTPSNLNGAVNGIPKGTKTYTTYLTGRPLESGPTGAPIHSVPSRSIPLPSPPRASPASNHPGVEAGPTQDQGQEEPTTPLTNYSSSYASGPDPGADSKHVDEGSVQPAKSSTRPSLLSPAASERSKRTAGGRTSGRRDRDDPVYDQVAAESDLLSSLSAADSNITHSPTPSTEETDLSKHLTIRTGRDEEVKRRQSKDEVCTSSPTSVASTSSSGQHLPSLADGSSNGTSLSITSRPGPIPGSRRLHLAHTSRVSKHRASVPSPHSPSFGSSDLALSPILEAANLATTANPASLHALLTRTTEPGKLLMAPVATQTTPHLNESGLTSPVRGYIQPCCVAARNEVDRLRRENAQLRSQVSELELSKENVDCRLKDLEERMKELGQTVDLLREEKSALMAAFSAGMVKSHSPPRLHKPLSSTGHLQEFSPTPQDLSPTGQRILERGSSRSPPGTHHTLDALSEEYEEEQLNEEYSNEPAGSDKPGETGNYAVGSQCLDSGILLRQGILRASSGSRGGSPATGTPGVQPTTHTPMRRITEPLSTTTTATTTSTPSANGTASKSYVNITRVAPRVPPKPAVMMQSTSSHLGQTDAKDHRISARTVTAVVSAQRLNMTTSDSPSVSNMIQDDGYIAPNATGSPSPAPVLASARPGPDMTTQIGSIPVDFPTSSPPAGLVGARLIQREELQKHHAQILASIAALPDYDAAASVETDGKRSAMSTPGASSSSNAAKSTGSLTGWAAPSSDKVVRCVEAIIVRIRSLVQLANGDRIGDCVNCSLLIQAAVQDILNLFPPLNQCPPKVAAALSDLSGASQSLRPHCEQMSRRTVGTEQTGQKALAPDVNILIRHAHQIAKAAKELLSIFQRAQ
ncbi:GIT2 [Fasciola hepatica]|uniref:GIT2 n=1 Tax=Fasciola hepatica TaxID=6192 RepID=A0A4E0R3N0_FASHE|nr:GIT2 [Fasciola hepatica]